MNLQPADHGEPPPPSRHGWAGIVVHGPGWIIAIASLVAALGGGTILGRVTIQPNRGPTPTSTVTQTVTAPPPPYIGHIVEWVNGPGQQNTSWLVESNGERYWIPTTSVFYCLLHRGTPI